MRMFPYSPINYSAAELYDVRCTLGRESGMIRCISGSNAPPPLDLKQKTRFQIQKEKKMYVQHPYKYEGKYYAKIDGVFYEISKEVAMAMFASGAETEEFFYRLGIKDGLRLKSTVKSVLEMMA